MQKLETPTQLMETVYNAILDAICDVRLVPNERITQEGLAEALGVSRQPILQAFHALKREGFITDAGRKGVMVTPLDPQQLIDLYQIRAALDGLAAREAAERMKAQHNPEQQRTGEALITAGRQAIASGLPANLIIADINFHQFIYQASGNRMIAATALIHWNHIRRAMGAILLSDIRPSDRVWDEHQAILDAVIMGNSTQAESLARRHAESAAEHLASVLMSDEYATKRKQA
ncbi:GntR family transcriptional regulator [Glaciimonas sp. PAMC28666]|uniref:GntR family transcriptional regulator n=1 Tax=Glaciimonas sp. PAMC28666 TaxID=2807626 RepID=UPI00196328C8|nr:GntR family transcriptional regulator [Glaciimonas sp. PAMC28666]QRX82268.1 GntR family transcriptional regulator [Glaciimonas sp. PAMC28666]